MIFGIQVHDSLDRYDPKRDNIRNKQGKPLNSEELKEIHGKAEVRILSEMAGYLIGKGGYNINKIKEESRVRSLYVDGFVLFWFRFVLMVGFRTRRQRRIQNFKRFWRRTYCHRRH